MYVFYACCVVVSQTVGHREKYVLEFTHLFFGYLELPLFQPAAWYFQNLLV